MKKQHTIILLFALFTCLEAVIFLWVDQPVSSALRTVDEHQKWIIDIFRAYTDFGKSKWYLWPSGLAVIFYAIALRVGSLTELARQKMATYGKKTLFFFLAIAVSGITTDIIKPILGRARPVMFEREGAYGFHPFTFHAAWNAMPSGHATTAFALALVLSVLFPRGKIMWWVMGCGLALSRVMVNAHYISDVLAGGLVAVATVYGLQVVSCHYGIVHARDSIFPIDRKNPSQ